MDDSAARSCWPVAGLKRRHRHSEVMPLPDCELMCITEVQGGNRAGGLFFWSSDERDSAQREIETKDTHAFVADSGPSLGGWAATASLASCDTLQMDAELW